MKRLFYLLLYVFIFIRELVLSTISVTKLVLSPSPKLKPGFLVVPMDAASDLEITFLANSITLTPGTISVYVDAPSRTLVIHAIDTGEDPDAVRRGIKSTLEAHILKWTRKPQPPRSDSP